MTAWLTGEWLCLRANNKKGEKLLERFPMLEQGGVIGRKADFLIQELNREANTIGSKCCDLEITEKVVALKAEIEKIREQIQNIE